MDVFWGGFVLVVGEEHRAKPGSRLYPPPPARTSIDGPGSRRLLWRQGRSRGHKVFQRRPTDIKTYRQEERPTDLYLWSSKTTQSNTGNVQTIWFYRLTPLEQTDKPRLTKPAIPLTACVRWLDKRLCISMSIRLHYLLLIPELYLWEERKEWDHHRDGKDLNMAIVSILCRVLKRGLPTLGGMDRHEREAERDVFAVVSCLGQTIETQSFQL